jgi:uptake hydrogenase large subunit
VGPFNRVEGDLEVALTIDGDRVREAHVNATMYRGFEQILQGKDPHDALVYVPRICGICSVSQSVAAARALADLAGVTMPPNGQLATNLILAVENLADHLTHFYLFFMPDFVRPVYANRPWHAEVLRRFSPDRGEQVRAATAARQRWFTLLGTLGGKWPHTQSVEPGGSTRPIDAAERVRLLARVREFRRFLEEQLFNAPLEAITSLDHEEALWAWHAQDPMGGDLRCFLSLVHDLGLQALGPGPGRYLSYGAYALPGGTAALPGGLWRHDTQSNEPVDSHSISEDATHAWLAQARAPLHPWHGLTRPEPDKPLAYTWNKAPRLGGEVIETGAIARQLTSAQPLVRDAVRRHGGGVYTRVLARLVELARVVPMMESWLQALRPGESLLRAHPPARARSGHGPVRGGARQPGPLGGGAAWPHRQLPDRRAHQLELLAARCRRRAGRTGTSPGGSAGKTGRTHPGRCPAHRSLLRPLHGLYGALDEHPPAPLRVFPPLWRAFGAGQGDGACAPAEPVARCTPGGARAPSNRGSLRCRKTAHPARCPPCRWRVWTSPPGWMSSRRWTRSTRA